MSDTSYHSDLSCYLSDCTVHVYFVNRTTCTSACPFREIK